MPSRVAFSATGPRAAARRSSTTAARVVITSATARPLRVNQVGETTFPEFASAAWKAGVLHYVVDLDARTCSYFGLGGESYVERYPAVSLTTSTDYGARTAGGVCSGWISDPQFRSIVKSCQVASPAFGGIRPLIV